jgi:protein SCO1/2
MRHRVPQTYLPVPLPERGEAFRVKSDRKESMRLSRSKLTRWSLPIIAVLLVLTVGTVLIGRAVNGSGEARLTGTDLGKTPAPDFTLTDQRGSAVTLSDFKSKTVVLTFIYTHCPDFCPLTAERLRAAYAQLPPARQEKVVMLAVTVDPARDTPAALQAFSAQHGLADNPNWYTLRGDQAALEQVWRAYGVDPGAMMTMNHAAMHDMTSTPAAPAGTLAHTNAVYLIDAKGRERVILTSVAEESSLVANLTALTD